MKAITNGMIITEKCTQMDKVLLFENKIVGVIDASQFNYEELSRKYGHLEVIDAKGHLIAPGFIDLHIHGSGGADIMDGTLDCIETISQTICKSGVTAFLPTTMTMPQVAIYKALDCIRLTMNQNIKGAKVLGAHMEGPFISDCYKGAQNANYLEKPGYAFIENYLDVIKIITLAPEIDHNLEFIKKIKTNGEIVLSIGHSNATYEQAIEAIHEGVSHSTHIFNGMSPFHHRKPGVVGAILNSPISCELIADLIHVHEGAIKLLMKVKENHRVVLITDGMRGSYLPDGHYELGGQEVTVKENSARLRDGTLAGSLLRLNKAVRNIYELTDLSLNEVINLATINPAKVIKIDASKGSIEESKDADIIIMDKDFNILTTYVEGIEVFNLLN
jgi:N-acetylglucosamine-6-phosphate deacetylase